MRQKKLNKTLFVVLLFSIIIMLALFFVLEFTKKNNSGSKTPEEEVNYYMPSVVTRRVVVPYGTKVVPEMFIQSVESIYDYFVGYEKAPDLEQYGVQDVIVLVTDTEGNTAAVKAQINILNIKDKVEINLGDSLPEAKEFLQVPGSEISYITTIDWIDTTQIAEHEINFWVDGDWASAVIEVNDLEAPVVSTRNLEAWLNHPFTAEDFVTEIMDSTDVEIYFEAEPDWSLPGEQEVSILAVDANQNLTVCTAVVTLYQDSKAPTVSVSNIDVTIGGVVSYRKALSYFDNASTEEEILLEIDNSKVNLNEIGTYEVNYKVTDFAGNSTSVVGMVNVVEEAPLWNDEEVLKEKALTVLSEILTNNMSDYEKAREIYKWVNSSIRFINYSEKDNFARGAYEGLFLKKGDCFVYAATSKYLLTLAGIPNIDIRKSSTDPSHYWNLVYVMDGWYHFDACPTREGRKLFLYTNAELEQFSASRGNSHVFDATLYPEIK